jgi:zinc protease
MIAGVNPHNIDQTIDLITEENRAYVTEPVAEEDHADSKSFFLGRMPLMLESIGGVAVSLLNMEHFDLGLVYFHNYPAKIQAVTPEEILQTSQKYLNPATLAVSVAGP